jgi:hypothetical protein
MLTKNAQVLRAHVYLIRAAFRRLMCVDLKPTLSPGLFCENVDCCRACPAANEPTNGELSASNHRRCFLAANIMQLKADFCMSLFHCII